MPCGSCLCCCRDKTSVGSEVDECYGPTSKRKCRDVFFLILFVAFWVGMVVIAAFAFSKGDINRLDHGIDMFGMMCGFNNRPLPFIRQSSDSDSDSVASASKSRFVPDTDLSGKPVLYWPTPFDRSIQICLPSCPSEFPSLGDVIDVFIPGAKGDAARAKLVCGYGVARPPTVFDVVAGDCWPPYKSKPVLGRCVPDVTNMTALTEVFRTLVAGIVAANSTSSNPAASNSTANNVHSSEGTAVPSTPTVSDALKLLYQAVNAREAFNQAFAELTRSWREVVGLCFASVLVAFLFVFLLRFFAGFIVWLVVLLVFAALVAVTALFWRLSEVLSSQLPIDPALRDPSDVTRIKVAKGFLYFMLAVDAVFLVLVVALRKRIALAVGIIRESGRCLTGMPSLVFFPFLTCIAQLVFLAYWVVVSSLIATAGFAPADSMVYGYKLDTVLRWFSLYHLFGLFWTMAMIDAVGQATIAMAVASWYWVLDKKDVPRMAPFRAFFTVLRYHLGSLALGSLIIAVVQFARAMLRYLEKKMRPYADRRIVRAIMCALHFFFWLLEKVLKFINKNAYIMIAIKGQGFCASAKRAFELLLSNILRVGVVNSISAFLLFLMRLLVALTCAIVAGVVMEERLQLKFWFVPVAIVFVVAFVVATSFTMVYSMAIDTILLSFCEDSSRNDGSPERPYYMSAGLRDFVDGHVKKKKDVNVTPTKKTVVKPVELEPVTVTDE